MMMMDSKNSHRETLIGLKNPMHTQLLCPNNQDTGLDPNMTGKTYLTWASPEPNPRNASVT